jgi:iron complex transport system substrate-binding protein
MGVIQLRRIRLSRRYFLVGVVGSAILAACGRDEEDASTPSATGSSADEPQASGISTGAPKSEIRLMTLPSVELGAPAVPEPAPSRAAVPVPYGPAVAPYAEYGREAAAGVFPRSVRHAMGETKFKEAPARVVALDTGEMDAVVNLGLKPVGIIEWAGASMPDYLKSGLVGANIVGTIAEPDIEAIAALNPDLLLTNKQRHEAIFSTLSAVAPVVYGARAGLVWRHNFELYAKALGREEQGAAIVKSYEDRVRDQNQRLPSPRPAVSVVRVRENQTLSYYQRANFLGGILTDLGFPRPASQNVDDFGLNEQSLETIGEFGGGDVIVLSVIGGEGNQLADQLKASALWRQLPAVREGRVLEVDDNVWIAGLGYIAAGLILDDIAAYFRV